MPFGQNDEIIFGHDDEVIDDASSKDKADREAFQTEFEDYAKKFGKSIVGAGEAAASVIAPLPSQIAGGLYGLGALLSGQGIDKAGSDVEKVMDWNFGAGAYKPVTETGQRYAEKTQHVLGLPGETAGDVGAFIGKQLGNEELGRLTAKLPVDAAMNFIAPASIVKAPIIAGKGIAKGIGKLKGKEVPVKETIADRLAKLDEIKAAEGFGKGDEVIPEDIEFWKQRAAQMTEEARAAQRPPEVLWAQHETPFNVDPVTGTPKQMEAMAKANEGVQYNQLPPDAVVPRDALKNEIGEPMLRVPRGNEWVKDENGMPVRQGLPESTMAPDYINRYMRQDEAARNDLGNAIQEANGPKLGPEQHWGSDPLGNQRGAIDLRAFEEGFQKFKQVTDNVRLVARGTGDGLEIQAVNKNGTAIGTLKLSSENWADPKATDNLRADWAESASPGMAKEMYKFASELGNDIVPSKAQTAEGKAMWDRFEKGGLSTGRIIKSGERGVLNTKDIGDVVKKLTTEFGKKMEGYSKIDISKLAPVDKQDLANSIPGMGKAVESIIPRPKDAESIITEGLKGKDIPDVWTDIASGPELVGEKYRNPIVSGVSSWLQWADKKAKNASEKLVRPMERTLASLSKQEMIDLADVLKTEMFSRNKFTAEELKSAGMSDKMVENYEKLRTAFDTAYEIQAKALEAQGKKAPTKQAAYLASIRGGNYHVNVKDSKGNTAWHIQTHSSFEARKAIDWLKKNVKDIDTNLKVEYRNPNISSGIPRDVLGGFQELMNLVDDGSDAALAIKEAIRNAQEQAGYNLQGHSNRFLEKANIRGFDGDMPWKSPEANARTLLQNQIDYLNDAYKWAYMQDSLNQVKQIVADERVNSQMPNTAEYVKEVVRSQLGLQQHLTKAAEEYVMNKMGLSRHYLNKATGLAGRATSLLQLGASTGYMIATPLTALYSATLHAREGTMSVRGMANATADMSTGILTLLFREQGKDVNLPMTELGRAALKYAEDNGVVSANMFGDLDRVNRNRLTSQALGKYEMTITVPEKIQRLSTFMGFVHGLKEKGGYWSDGGKTWNPYDNMYDIFQRAETLTNLAATNFRPSEQPIGVQKFGTVGSMAFKYKAPILNYYHQLHMASIDARNGNVKPLTAILGMTAVLAGVQNLPGVNEADGAWNLFKKAVANFSPEDYSKVKDIDVKDFIRQNVPEVMANGAVQEAMGAQMSQRFGSDLVNLEDPLKNAFPVTGALGSIASAPIDLAKGNVAQAAWDVAPQLGRGNLETRVDAFRGQQPNTFRKPSDISNPDIQQARTERDITMRKFGLRSSEEAKRMETRAMVNKEEQRINTALDGNVEKLVDNALKGNSDKASMYARAYLQLNPDDAALQSAISSKLEKARLTPEQRDLIKAKAIQQIQKVKRLMDARK